MITEGSPHSVQLKKKRSDFPGVPVRKTQASNAGGPSSIPSQGTRSHMPVCMLQLRSSAAIKINK